MELSFHIETMEKSTTERSVGGGQGQNLFKFMDILRDITQDISFFLAFIPLYF